MNKNIIIDQKATLLDAMMKIDENREGFLIVLDDKQKVVGTLSDGDIRRCLIKIKNLYSPVSDAMNIDFQYLNNYDLFQIVAEKFKNSKIEFLPILKNGSLHNILTKKAFQIMLLEDSAFSLEEDFSKYHTKGLEYEIYNRPWGFYKSTLYTEFAQSKIITVFPEEELSLQEHKKREEHWIVVKGKGIVILGESEINVSAGSYIYIPKGVKHRIENCNSSENLIFAEVQLGEYFGEDDIIRYSDKYGRV